MNKRELRKLSLLAEVAYDYYERGLSQNEIGKRMCLSRTRISRLLKEAKELGIVTVAINYPYERHYDFEKRIEDRFPVKNVYILNRHSCTPETIPDNVAKLAANYITGAIKKDIIIGVSWGTTVANTVQYIQPAPYSVQIVQLMGAVPCKEVRHSPQGIVTALSKTLGGNGNFLNLPLYIENEYVRKTMCEDINNKKILNEGMFSDMILTSVSSIDTIRQQNFWLSYMTPELYEEARRKGAIGAMFGRFYDKNGNEVNCEWNKRCVSISFDHIRGVPDVIVIACGEQKTNAVYAALKGKLIDTLIIDSDTAARLLGLT